MPKMTPKTEKICSECQGQAFANWKVEDSSKRKLAILCAADKTKLFASDGQIEWAPMPTGCPKRRASDPFMAADLIKVSSGHTV